MRSAIIAILLTTVSISAEYIDDANDAIVLQGSANTRHGKQYHHPMQFISPAGIVPYAANMFQGVYPGLMERRADSGMPQVQAYNKPMASVRSIYSQCGTNKYLVRVSGGLPARQGEFPWTVALFKNGQHFCGGSLISPTHILTAAHCVATMSDAEARQVVVRLGDHNLDDPNDVQSVEKQAKLIVKNKLFSMQTLHHDVAIIVMDSPVEYTDNIRPICLANEGSDVTGQDVTVSGWGLLSVHGPKPPTLQKLTMKAWNQDECKQKYVTGSPAGITSHMLCAGGKNMDSCMGDSGGPLVHGNGNGVSFEQVGIVSWGIGCGIEGFPGVYTRVSEMRSWISKVTSAYP